MSRGVKIVRVKTVRVKIADREMIVETAADVIAVGAMTVVIVAGANVRAVVVPRVSLRARSLRLSHLFCRANRFRSIAVEKMVRPKPWLPNLRRPM